MNVQQPLFLIPMISGVTFIVAGLILKKFPPRNINSLYGYRTGRSMKSQQAWDFAQLYSASEAQRIGLGLALASVGGLFIQPHEGVSIGIAVGLVLCATALLLIRVERAIKRNVTDGGKR